MWSAMAATKTIAIDEAPKPDEPIDEPEEPEPKHEEPVPEVEVK